FDRARPPARAACAGSQARARLPPVTYSARSAIDDAPSQLATALEALRSSQPDLIDLTVSNPTRVGLSYAGYGLEGLAASSAGATYSPDPLGLASAREAVSRHWHGRGARPDPEHVL